MNTATKIISVIIPVFQDLNGITKCINSLQKQTISPQEFEIIVIDNGSKPPIRKTDLPESRASLKLIQHQTPGSYAARNAGVRVASGELLAFTDADCLPDKAWIENGVKHIERAESEIIIGGEIVLIPPEAKTAVSMYQTIVGFQQQENISKKGFSATANLICRRDTFSKIGEFDERLFSCGDREWCWRAQSLGVKILFAPDAIINTPPRKTLSGAIRQARRVAAGRDQLSRLGVSYTSPNNLTPHRTPLSSLSWIINHQDLSATDRLQVLSIASIIKATSIIEEIRIRLGGQAERR